MEKPDRGFMGSGRGGRYRANRLTVWGTEGEESLISSCWYIHRHTHQTISSSRAGISSLVHDCIFSVFTTAAFDI